MDMFINSQVVLKIRIHRFKAIVPKMIKSLQL
nr:MAG TPA: hypothetical protein [Caudoviricetes sp.]